jgi:hypothetical protein
MAAFEVFTEGKAVCNFEGEVWEAYKRVKANQGAAGVDEQSIADFERDLKGNLYESHPEALLRFLYLCIASGPHISDRRENSRNSKFEFGK